MTLQYGFYNSVNGDRKYDARDFGGVFDAIMSDGVNRGVGQEFVVTIGSGREFSVGTGRAWYLRTWSFNDAAVPMTADAGDAANPRLDVVVLDVNTADAIRENNLRVVKGTPSGTPVLPTLINTATRIQVPLYSILVPAGATSLLQSNVTKLIGTITASPYAGLRLENPQQDPAIMHRNTFRGKYLGSSYTPEQKAAVRSGLFENLFLGDYWTINGVNWRIVDMDYYYHEPLVYRVDVPASPEDGIEYNTRVPHHLVVMPDNSLRRGRMNEDNAKGNAGGYNGGDFRVNHLPQIFTTVASAFGGADSLIPWADVWSTALTEGRVSEDRWFVGCQVELPNQVQMFGYNLHSPRSRGEDSPPSLTTASAIQFALFRMAPRFIRPNNPSANDRTTWLRDPVNLNSWAVVESSGAITRAISTSQYGFRPYFLI